MYIHQTLLDQVRRILQLLSFQIGKEVSLHEIGTQCGLHKDTVQRYIDLLKKRFILGPVINYSPGCKMRWICSN